MLFRSEDKKQGNHLRHISSTFVDDGETMRQQREYPQGFLVIWFGFSPYGVRQLPHRVRFELSDPENEEYEEMRQWLDLGEEEEWDVN